MSMAQKRNDIDTAFFCPEFLYPDAPSNSYKTLRRDVLDSFPGIWFVTADGDGELIVVASENYWQKARGNWHTLPPKKLPNGLVVNWLIRPPMVPNWKGNGMMYLQKSFTVPSRAGIGGPCDQLSDVFT